MTAPLTVHTLSVPVEHGQILLGDAVEGDPDAVEDALDDAIDSGRYVGAAGGLVDIMTPVADSTGTPVTVEEWATEPPDDRGDWDHEVDLDLDLPSGRVEVQLTTGQIEDGVVTLTAAGARRLRVSARFAPDVYRLRLWPRTVDAPPVVRLAWPGWPDF
jgi:hypothetical protein